MLSKERAGLPADAAAMPQEVCAQGRAAWPHVTTLALASVLGPAASLAALLLRAGRAGVGVLVALQPARAGHGQIQ